MKYYLLKLINEACPIDMYDLGFRHSIADSVGHSCGDGCDVIVRPIDSCVDSLSISDFSVFLSDKTGGGCVYDDNHNLVVCNLGVYRDYVSRCVGVKGISFLDAFRSMDFPDIIVVDGDCVESFGYYLSRFSFGDICLEVEGVYEIIFNGVGV